MDRFGIAHKLRGAAKHPHMDNTCKLSVFDVAEAADRITALEKALEKAKALLDCVQQRSSDNFWWINADDPETAVCNTYADIVAALSGRRDQGEG